MNLALVAIDHFNRFLGLGPAIVTRERLAQSAPRALDEEQQRDLVRAAEDASPRDRAIVVLLLHTGVRLSELVDLDVGDVPTTPTPKRSSRRSSTGPGSRPGSTRSSTPERSAASSSTGTTTVTATQASAS